VTRIGETEHTILDGQHVQIRAGGPEYDSIVSMHWEKMWNGVGIDKVADNDDEITHGGSLRRRNKNKEMSINAKKKHHVRSRSTMHGIQSRAHHHHHHLYHHNGHWCHHDASRIGNVVPNRFDLLVLLVSKNALVPTAKATQFVPTKGGRIITFTVAIDAHGTGTEPSTHA
jgi:hypothetical protein